jgi:hypothetical protein
MKATDTVLGHDAMQVFYFLTFYFSALKLEAVRFCEKSRNTDQTLHHITEDENYKKRQNSKCMFEEEATYKKTLE